MLGGTGLLTRDLLLSDYAFPPMIGQWPVQSRQRSLTVAGQWRIFTALPEHPTSELPYADSATGKQSPMACHTVMHLRTDIESQVFQTFKRAARARKQMQKYKSRART